MTQSQQQQPALKRPWSAPRLQAALIAQITANNIGTVSDNQCTGSRGRFQQCS